MNRYFFAAAAAALSTATLFAVPQAFAEDTKLSWSDLDLSTKDGQRTLDHRIRAISERMCADQVQTGSHINRETQCRAQVTSQIAAQVAAKNSSRIALSH